MSGSPRLDGTNENAQAIKVGKMCTDTCDIVYKHFIHVMNMYMYMYLHMSKLPHHTHRIVFFMKTIPSSDNFPVAITSAPNTQSLASLMANRPALRPCSQPLHCSMMRLVGCSVWQVGEGGGQRRGAGGGQRQGAGGGVAQLLT